MTNVSEESKSTSLRGAQANTVKSSWPTWLARGFFVIAGLCVVVGFASVHSSNAQIDRIRLHGIPVVVKVLSCNGNIGGTGSTSAGYTCIGSYRVAGELHHSVIGGLTQFQNSGSLDKGLSDPSNRNVVELARFAQDSYSRWSAYAGPIIALMIYLALLLLGAVKVRRSRSNRVDVHSR